MISALCAQTSCSLATQAKRDVASVPAAGLVTCVFLRKRPFGTSTRASPKYSPDSASVPVVGLVSVISELWHQTPGGPD